MGAAGYEARNIITTLPLHSRSSLESTPHTEKSSPTRGNGFDNRTWLEHFPVSSEISSPPNPPNLSRTYLNFQNYAVSFPRIRQIVNSPRMRSSDSPSATSICSRTLCSGRTTRKKRTTPRRRHPCSSSSITTQTPSPMPTSSTDSSTTTTTNKA